MAKSNKSFRRRIGLKESEELELKKKDEVEVAEAEEEEEKEEEEEEVADEEEEEVKEEEGEEEKEEEEVPAEEEEEVKEAGDEDDLSVAVDDLAAAEDEDEDIKEFDLNDESDIFLSDEEEAEAEKAAAAESTEEELPAEEVPAEEEEEEEEVKEDEEEEKEDEEEEEVKEEEGEEKEEKEEEEDVEECDLKKPKLDVEEDMKALFSGQELTEDFQKKTRVIFEAACRKKVVEFAKTLKGRYNKKLRKAKSKIQESLVSKVDNYLNYVVEEWMEDNKIAVQHGLRTEITEEFIDDLRSLFERHNIMVPKNKEDLVESQAKKIAELEKNLSEEIKKAVVLRKKLNEQSKDAAFKEICSDLADTEIEKFKKLASSLEYDAAYKEKLLTIKESYFPKKKVAAGDLSEPTLDDENKNENKTPVGSPDMMQYAKVLSKFKTY